MNQAPCSLFYNRNKMLMETHAQDKVLRFLIWTAYQAISQMISYSFVLGQQILQSKINDRLTHNTQHLLLQQR